MADAFTTLKADILVQLQGSVIEPINVGVVEIPLRTEVNADGTVGCVVDTSACERFGRALAEALKTAKVDLVRSGD